MTGLLMRPAGERHAPGHVPRRLQTLAGPASHVPAHETAEQAVVVTYALSGDGFAP
ncbi:hypothetical protein J2S43_002612 [Catenuloplanes nepalensis]|uniref:Uncharacterized protein n=1 Tax=Catenuloplanes nepalensis TaxID=587533 RepID=A0ABT9MRR2_9ACTN|nr:hypothetical protein [Catenuloplanes nepalensis]MDP9794100.1 hypothetical protein [Catenuloplanes nepalensis]